MLWPLLKRYKGSVVTLRVRPGLVNLVFMHCIIIWLGQCPTKCTTYIRQAEESSQRCGGQPKPVLSECQAGSLEWLIL